jgi:rubrerythrin
MWEGKTMSKTKRNLEEAFARESQATRRYLAYGERAAEESKEGIRRLLTALAESEAVHASNHLNHLKGIKTTEENLRQALAGEMQTYESKYPQMIADAKEEGEKGPEMSFTHANEVEKVHYRFLEQALNDLDNFSIQDYYVCKGCGYMVANEPPDSCPVCGAAKKALNKVK